MTVTRHEANPAGNLPCLAAGLLAVCIYFMSWQPALSQDAAAEPSREEWLLQVERARERVDKIRREGKFVDDSSESSNDADEASARRALEDDGLQPGDIVSTGGGLLRFEGPSSSNQRIFVPLNESRDTPGKN